MIRFLFVSDTLFELSEVENELMVCLKNLFFEFYNWRSLLINFNDHKMVFTA